MAQAYIRAPRRTAATRRPSESGITTLVVVSVVLSWAAVHVVFTLRSARLYHAQDGGIDFHADAPPDFKDFLYVALTIGMTFQVSDTDLTPSRFARRRYAMPCCRTCSARSSSRPRSTSSPHC
ncbi:MAG TPA: DUF1345 domain-containing protein [Candidatus Saccharimonadales bacterium]|nr:DUF1345 domain-containing protein [Candidatus Saccharimonadales bacterium]